MISVQPSGVVSPDQDAVKQLGGPQPQEKHRRQQPGNDGNGPARAAGRHPEGVAPRHVQPLLPAAADLVQADRREGAEQADAGQHRVEQRHQIAAQREAAGDEADDRVDQPQEYQMRWFGPEIGEPPMKRRPEIGDADLAHHRFGGGGPFLHNCLSARHGQASSC